MARLKKLYVISLTSHISQTEPSLCGLRNEIEVKPVSSSFARIIFFSLSYKIGYHSVRSYVIADGVC